MPNTTMVPRKYKDSSIFGDHTCVRKIAWKTKYTGTVGRNRQNAERTAANGISSRGKGVLRRGLPGRVAEVAPLVTEVLTSWNANNANVRWAKKVGSFSLRMI